MHSYLYGPGRNMPYDGDISKLRSMMEGKATCIVHLDQDTLNDAIKKLKPTTVSKRPTVFSHASPVLDELEERFEKMRREGKISDV
jgi:hypothetical protein